MMHMFHEGCGRLGELVHRFAVCRHGWRRLRTHVILLFPHCFTPCAPERETLSAPEPTMVKHSESITAGGISTILKTFKQFQRRRWSMRSPGRPDMARLRPIFGCRLIEF